MRIKANICMKYDNNYYINNYSHPNGQCPYLLLLQDGDHSLLSQQEAVRVNILLGG